jgi:hypothetical protein
LRSSSHPNRGPASQHRPWGLGFGVWGVGFGVWGLGFGVWGLGPAAGGREGPEGWGRSGAGLTGARGGVARRSRRADWLSRLAAEPVGSPLLLKPPLQENAHAPAQRWEPLLSPASRSCGRPAGPLSLKLDTHLARLPRPPTHLEVCRRVAVLAGGRVGIPAGGAPAGHHPSGACGCGLLWGVAV